MLVVLGVLCSDGAFYFRRNKDKKAFCFVHILVRIHEKRNFAGMVKVKDSNVGRLSWILKVGLP